MKTQGFVQSTVKRKSSPRLQRRTWGGCSRCLPLRAYPLAVDGFGEREFESFGLVDRLSTSVWHLSSMFVIAGMIVYKLPHVEVLGTVPGS